MGKAFSAAECKELGKDPSKRGELGTPVASASAGPSLLPAAPPSEADGPGDSRHGHRARKLPGLRVIIGVWEAAQLTVMEAAIVTLPTRGDLARVAVVWIRWAQKLSQSWSPDGHDQTSARSGRDQPIWQLT